MGKGEGGGPGEEILEIKKDCQLNNCLQFRKNSATGENLFEKCAFLAKNAQKKKKND